MYYGNLDLFHKILLYVIIFSTTLIIVYYLYLLFRIKNKKEIKYLLSQEVNTLVKTKQALESSCTRLKKEIDSIQSEWAKISALISTEKQKIIKELKYTKIEIQLLEDVAEVKRKDIEEKISELKTFSEKLKLIDMKGYSNNVTDNQREKVPAN